MRFVRWLFRKIRNVRIRSRRAIAAFRLPPVLTREEAVEVFISYLAHDPTMQKQVQSILQDEQSRERFLGAVYQNLPNHMRMGVKDLHLQDELRTGVVPPSGWRGLK